MNGTPTAPAEEGPKKTGRPTKRTDEVIQRVLDGLSEGTPLTVICDAEDMPNPSTVWDWMKSDEALSQAIAQARACGYDRIAMDALAIADDTSNDTLTIKKGEAEIEIPNKEWILRSKLRVDLRLKLLSKWDPKRYGDKLAVEASGPGGGPVRTSVEISPELQAEILRKTAEAAGVAATVQPPAKHQAQGNG